MTSCWWYMKHCEKRLPRMWRSFWDRGNTYYPVWDIKVIILSYLILSYLILSYLIQILEYLKTSGLKPCFRHPKACKCVQQLCLSVISFLQHRWPIQFKFSHFCYVLHQAGIHQLKIQAFDNYQTWPMPLTRLIEKGAGFSRANLLILSNGRGKCAHTKRTTNNTQSDRSKSYQNLDNNIRSYTSWKI